MKDQQAVEAAKMLALGQATKVETDRRAAETANIARQQPLNNIYYASNPITLKVAPAPVTLSLAESTSVKAGAMVEVPATITRLFAYTDQVTIVVSPPPGVNGVSIQSVVIPANQTAGKLTIVTTPNAPVGQHKLSIRASMALNGQTIILEQPLMLTIEAAPAS